MVLHGTNGRISCSYCRKLNNFRERDKMTTKARLNALKNQLVPPSGKAPTVAGEMVRAILQVDTAFTVGGDRPGTGCGIHTCNIPLRYLKQQFPGKIAARVDEVWNWEGLSDKEYAEKLQNLERAILAYIDSNPGTTFMENRVQFEWFAAAIDRREK